MRGFKSFTTAASTLAGVFVGFRDARLEQVRAGMVWHYKDYQRE